MDNRRFDAITRGLAARSNRRSLIRGGFTAAIGAAFAIRSDAAKAQGVCTNPLQDCDANQICLDGACSDCTAGLEACGVVCVDLSGDVYHCGSCGNFCGGVPSPGYSSIGECVQGECVAVCLTDADECNGECTDLSSDDNNCGACGNFCGGVPSPGYSSIGECVQGECVAVCLPDADECGGECTDLTIDVNNCGTCGNQCISGQNCCQGQCVDRDSAERFCDFCGFLSGWPQGCSESEVCSGGFCLPVASAPVDEAPADEVPTGTDPADVAYQLSILESQSAFDDLYDRMHPDAQIVVPRGTVTYWYSQYFAPLGPQPIIVTGVEYTDWTWEVIDRSYPGAAVVSFQQDFTNSSTVSEVVRLVQDTNGEWRWFFGRSENFVDQMNLEAENAGEIDDDASVPESSGIEPEHLFAESIAAIDSVAPSCVDSEHFYTVAPDLLQGAEKDPELQHPDSDTARFAYVPVELPPGDVYPDLIVNAIALEAGEFPELRLADLEQSISNWQGPELSLPPRVLNGDLAPASDFLISYYEEYTELLGHVPVITFGKRGGSLLFTISGPAIVAVNELLSVWSETVLSENPACTP